MNEECWCSRCGGYAGEMPEQDWFERHYLCDECLYEEEQHYNQLLTQLGEGCTN